MTSHRIGLMGCGVVAGYGHLPALAAAEGLELAAVFDPDEERARAAAAAQPGATAFIDEAAFLASDIEAVVITSPAPCHRDNALAAARAGKHMLCEKPLASTEAECRAMIDAAAAAGVMLFTAFDYRFSPAAQRIRGLVAEGAVGTVRSLRLLYLWHLHGKFVADAEGRRVANARRHGRMLEGGPMVDCGVHQIDLARWWLQSEVCAWTAAGAWVEAYAAPDHVYLHLDHENGAHTCVEMSYSYGHTAAEPSPRFLYELIGTEGLIRYDRESRRFELRDPRGTRELAWSPEKNFAGMYAAFARALAGEGADDLPTGEDGLAAARLSREATEALIAGRRDRQWA